MLLVDFICARDQDFISLLKEIFLCNYLFFFAKDWKWDSVNFWLRKIGDFTFFRCSVFLDAPDPDL